MSSRRGRIVIVSDLRPGELLGIAEEIAVDSQCGIEDLRGDKKGFQIYDAKGEAPIYTIGTLIASSAGILRVPLDIEVTVGRTKRDDGRITLDWIETGNALRPSLCRTFVESLADEIESRIEGEEGEVFESYDD